MKITADLDPATAAPARSAVLRRLGPDPADLVRGHDRPGRDRRGPRRDRQRRHDGRLRGVRAPVRGRGPAGASPATPARSRRSRFTPGATGRSRRRCGTCSGGRVGAPVSDAARGRARSRFRRTRRWGELRPPAQRAEDASRAGRRGFRAVKLRIARDRIDEGVGVVAAVRDAVGDRLEIIVDLNQWWRMPGDIEPGLGPADARARDRAAARARRAVGRGAARRRRPRRGCGCCARGTGVRIAGGEMARTFEELRLALEPDALDVYQPDVVLVAGDLGRADARRAGAAAQPVVHPPYLDQRDRRCWPTCTSARASAAGRISSSRTTRPGGRPSGATSCSPSRWRSTPTGCVVVPDAPGLGIELDEEAIAFYAVDGGAVTLVTPSRARRLRRARQHGRADVRAPGRRPASRCVRSTSTTPRWPARVEPARSAAGSAADCADGAEALITMLPGAAAGRAGAARRRRRDRRARARLDRDRDEHELARGRASASGPPPRERGIEVLDAPVAGQSIGARPGRWRSTSAATAAVFERARPLFEAIGDPDADLPPRAQRRRVHGQAAAEPAVVHPRRSPPREVLTRRGASGGVAGPAPRRAGRLARQLELPRARPADGARRRRLRRGVPDAAGDQGPGARGRPGARRGHAGRAHRAGRADPPPGPARRTATMPVRSAWCACTRSSPARHCGSDTTSPTGSRSAAGHVCSECASVELASTALSSHGAQLTSTR